MTIYYKYNSVLILRAGHWSEIKSTVIERTCKGTVINIVLILLCCLRSLGQTNRLTIRTPHLITGMHRDSMVSMHLKSRQIFMTRLPDLIIIQIPSLFE